MDVQPDIATVAAHFADASRASILYALLEGQSLPAGRLADCAGVAASTISGHLSRLVDAGLVTVSSRGRNRWFRIADDRVVVVMESLLALSETPEPVGLRAYNSYRRLRVARTCYDHAAGGLGTDLLAGMLEQDVLRRTDGRPDGSRAEGDSPSSAVPHAPYGWGERASQKLEELGVDVVGLESARRPALRACVDWTEQRHHIGGGLGAALLSAFLDRGWVVPRRDRRDLRVEHPELIAGWLGRE